MKFLSELKPKLNFEEMWEKLGEAAPSESDPYDAGLELALHLRTALHRKKFVTWNECRKVLGIGACHAVMYTRFIVEAASAYDARLLACVVDNRGRQTGCIANHDFLKEWGYTEFPEVRVPHQ